MTRSIFPPDPAINLYEDGFDASDPFNRKESGQALSDLVERIDQPLVIALDGGWGCGKTWFLKRWVGEHRKQEGNRAMTVYFDAFAHDFMDDPLIALTGVIGDQLKSATASTGSWHKVKTAAAKLARPVLRIAASAATGGLSEITGPALDAAGQTAQAEAERAAEVFWRREDGRRAAIEELRSALIELTRSGGAQGGDAVPLVVVVDELDRCRPDYALALLEVIKHFFSVPNVHFVLGVNLEALAHSVRARYGAGIDAPRYLRRFISVSMQLPEETSGHDPKPVVLGYFRQMGGKMNIARDIIDIFDRHLSLVAKSHPLTMRDANQILARVALMDQGRLLNMPHGWHECAASMVLLHEIEPKLAEKAIKGTLTMEDVHSLYGVTPPMLMREDRETYDHVAAIITGLWGYLVTDGDGSGEDGNYFARQFDAFGRYDHPRKIPKVVQETFLKFTPLNSED